MTTQEELLAHAGFVKALARRLVLDEHRAADVTQEAMVTALERPPSTAVPLRAWMARVVRNVSRQMLRAESRRKHHEAVASSPVIAAPPDERAALKEAIRTMTETVLNLSEPYRTTILLRYYEDLKIEEIARREQVPTATAKSRLRRGLDQLRGRLDAAHRGERGRWLRSLAPLAGLKIGAAAGATASTSAAAIGGLGLSVKAKLAVAAAVAAILVLPALAVVEAWPFTPPTPPPVKKTAATPPPMQDPTPPADVGAAGRGLPAVVAAEAAAESDDPKEATPPDAVSTPEEPVAAAREVRAAPVPLRGECTLRWTLTKMAALAPVRLRLFRAADPRDEWKDTPVSSFFAGMRLLCEPLESELDRNVAGESSGPGEAKFEVTELPNGFFVICIEIRGQGGFAKDVRLDPDEAADLGPIQLADRKVRIQVTEKETNRPVAGAEVRQSASGFILGEARRTELDGTLAWDHFIGTGVRVVKDGYCPSGVRARGNEVRVQLVRSRMCPIPAPPGTHVFSERPPFYTVAGPGGNVQVPVPVAGNRPALLTFYEPERESWCGRTLADGRLLSGSSTLTAKVTAGGQPLPAGSLTLFCKDTDKRFLVMAGIKTGAVTIPDILAGRYAVEVRCCPQIHDNDHEYYAREIVVKEGRNDIAIDVPGATLSVQIVAKGGKPLRFTRVTYYVGGEDKKRELRYRVKCDGRTDADGKVTFTALPAVEGELRIGSMHGTTMKITPSPRTQIVQL